jgi:hypothetical protein
MKNISLLITVLLLVSCAIHTHAGRTNGRSTRKAMSLFGSNGNNRYGHDGSSGGSVQSSSSSADGCTLFYGNTNLGHGITACTNSETYFSPTGTTVAGTFYSTVNGVTCKFTLTSVTVSSFVVIKESVPTCTSADGSAVTMTSLRTLVKGGNYYCSYDTNPATYSSWPTMNTPNKCGQNHVYGCGLSHMAWCYSTKITALSSTGSGPKSSSTGPSMPSSTGSGPKSSSTGPSMQSSTGSPVQSSTGSSVQSSTGSPVQSSTGSPVQSSTGSPVQSSTGSPVQSSTGSPVQSSTGSPVQSSTGSPVQSSTGSPVQSSTGSPVQSSTGSPVQSSTGPGPSGIYPDCFPTNPITFPITCPLVPSLSNPTTTPYQAFISLNILLGRLNTVISTYDAELPLCLDSDQVYSLYQIATRDCWPDEAMTALDPIFNTIYMLQPMTILWAQYLQIMIQTVESLVWPVGSPQLCYNTFTMANGWNDILPLSPP